MHLFGLERSITATSGLHRTFGSLFTKWIHFPWKELASEMEMDLVHQVINNLLFCIYLTFITSSEIFLVYYMHNCTFSRINIRKLPIVLNSRYANETVKMASHLVYIIFYKRLQKVKQGPSVKTMLF